MEREPVKFVRVKKREGDKMGLLDKYISRTEYVEGLTLDIGYQISECFYFGPARFIPNEIWLKKRAAIYRPQIDLYEGFALSREIYGKEEEIEKYLAHVMELSKEYGKVLQTGDPYFWMNPIVYQKQKDLINFAWYDNFRQASEILLLLQSNQTGLIFNDQAYDWEVKIFADPTRFYFIYRNPSEDRDLWLVNTDRERIQLHAYETFERVKSQISRFSKYTGVDFWTEGVF